MRLAECGLMRLIESAHLAILVMSALAGCSSSVSFEQFRSDVRLSRCDAVYRCVEHGEAPAWWPREEEYGASVEQCAALRDPIRDQEYDLLAASLKAGRVEYDGGLAADCLDRLENEYEKMKCEYLWDRPPSLDVCADIFAGTVPVSGACWTAADCTDNMCAVSNFDENGHQVLPGKCE